MNRTSPLLWLPCPWVCAAALLMLAAAGLTAAAQGDRLRDRLQQRALQEPPWDDERDGRRSQAAPPPPTGTRVLRDLAYGQDRWQRMEVYLPPHAQAAPVRMSVQGVVLLDSGALDMPEIMNERPARRFYPAFGRVPAYWLRVSPLQQLQAGLPPTLRVSSSPRCNSCTPAQAYARKSQGQGGQAEALPAALSHGQINAQWGVAGPYTEAVDGFLSRLAGWAPR